MLMEPEIYALCQRQESFSHSYFAYLDEYEALLENYLTQFAALEETLDAESLNTLGKMLKCQKEMERFRMMHHFRQGVLLGKSLQKQGKIY